MKRACMLAVCATLVAPAALADDLVSDTRDADAFTAAFCAADRSTQHIFIVPMSVFQAGGEVTCDDGASTLRMTEPADDPGHAVVNIDPPAGVADGFDCDGKADLGMGGIVFGAKLALWLLADRGTEISIHLFAPPGSAVLDQRNAGRRARQGLVCGVAIGRENGLDEIPS